MNIYVKNAKYIGDFKFDIEFNCGQKIIDLKKIGEVDNRYDKFAIFHLLKDEKFVSKMKSNGVTLSHDNIDIAPEILYQASI